MLALAYFANATFAQVVEENIPPAEKRIDRSRKNRNSYRQTISKYGNKNACLILLPVTHYYPPYIS